MTQYLPLWNRPLKSGNKLHALYSRLFMIFHLDQIFWHELNHVLRGYGSLESNQIWVTSGENTWSLFEQTKNSHSKFRSGRNYYLELKEHFSDPSMRGPHTFRKFTPLFSSNEYISASTLEQPLWLNIGRFRFVDFEHSRVLTGLHRLVRRNFKPASRQRWSQTGSRFLNPV